LRVSDTVPHDFRVGALAWWTLRGAALTLLLCAALGTAPRTAAQEAPGYDSTDGCAGSWQSHFGVQVLILDCDPGFATAHDRAYMYRRGSVDTGVDWRSQLDFTDAVWVFDAGARGKASLIIDFRRDGQRLVADLFDDVNLDGEVRYGLERGYPKSVESRFPTVKVTARDGWWARAGLVNYDITIAIDGPVVGPFGSQTFVDWTYTDGRPDIVTTVHDTQDIGRPHWQISQMDPPGSDSDGIVRTFLTVNVKNDEKVPETYILWPHLGFAGDGQPPPEEGMRAPLSAHSGANYGIQKRNKEAYPPIQVHWEHSKIEVVGEMVASHGYHHWYIQSVIRFGGDRTVANFENPFLFYDFAEANDGFPDLVIRDDFYPANDPWTPNGPFHNLRYSWDDDHDHFWDYGLNVFARAPMTTLVDVGEGVRVQTLPYDDAPAWVVDQSWETIAFTAIENRAAAHAQSTEGIYNPVGAPWDPYYFGHTSTKPSETFIGAYSGWRTDFSSYVGEPVQLYLSAVDRKLHLYKAEVGQWDLTARRDAKEDQPAEQVRYSSLGSPYVRRWEYLTDGVVVQSLAHLADRLIYWDSGGVQIAKGPDDPALFVTLPPTNRQEMLALRDRLPQGPDAGPGADLLDAFDAFPDDRISLPGLQLWDLRAEGDGFRFMGILTDPVPDTPMTQGLAPGTYVFTYTPVGGLTVRPAGPARLTLTSADTRGDAPVEKVPLRIATEVKNEGDHDALAVPVAFWATRGGRERILVGAAQIDITAGSTMIAESIWAAPVAGEWEIHASAMFDDGSDSPATRFRVDRAPAVDVGSLLLAQGLSPFSGGAISASLTLAVAISTGLGFAVWRAPRRRAQAADDL
jgi:hypothetical protein